MDFLRITPTDIYGALYTPIVFQFATEITEINYDQQTNPVAFMSAEGRAKSFQRPRGRAIRFTINVRTPATIKKIDDLDNYVQLGYMFNCNILSGMLSYNQALDEAQFSASRGQISQGHVMNWAAWQTAIGTGLQFGAALPLEIVEGSKESEPNPNDYIGVPPMSGGN